MTYGGRDHSGCLSETALASDATSDGGSIIVGSTSSFGASWTDMWVVKLEPNGEIDWEKAFGDENEDAATTVIQTSDGGYVVAPPSFHGSGRQYEWEEGFSIF